LVAELFGLVLEGVTDGGSAKLDALYKRQVDGAFGKANATFVRSKVDEALNFIRKNLGESFKGTPLAKHYHIYTMVAAYLYQKEGIPKGDVIDLPNKTGLGSIDDIRDRIVTLAAVLEDEITSSQFNDYCESPSSLPNLL
jgi:hypothetical protein